MSELSKLKDTGEVFCFKHILYIFLFIFNDFFKKGAREMWVVIMEIKNINFETWCRNHVFTHSDKWCREVYPWVVFNKIDFSKNKTGQEQTIDFNNIEYIVIILSIDVQENKRIRATFKLITKTKNTRSVWMNRSWSTIFVMIYTDTGEFITVYTKRKDPSKELVKYFMNQEFDKVYDYKSLPVSNLLFRSLISYIAEEQYKNATYCQKFELEHNGIRELPQHPQFFNKKKNFYPLFSVGRELWISYSFDEEKAHRIAFQMANQCENYIVVYCNPTYTKHHRCNYTNTEVLSLYEFFDKASPEIRKKFESRIRYLQSHMNNQGNCLDIELILNEIENPLYHEYEIQKSELMESFGIMKVISTDKYDAMYFFAAMNLINSFLTKMRKEKKMYKYQSKLLKNMYFFKTYVQKNLINLIDNNVEGVDVYIDVENSTVLVNVFDFQFSFKNVPLNNQLLLYSKSSRNQFIDWKGKRLQPIASLVLNYARELRTMVLTDRHL